MEEEREKLEKRLKFEKESCEFQYKMEHKTWQREKKNMEHKIQVIYFFGLGQFNFPSLFISFIATLYFK